MDNQYNLHTIRPIHPHPMLVFLTSVAKLVGMGGETCAKICW